MPDINIKPSDPPAIARLRRAEAVLRRQNDPDLHAVADGLAAYLTGAAPTLDEALDVKPQPGQRRPVTLADIAERKELLRQAAAEFFPGQSARQQGAALHRAITRYAAAGWRHDRNEVEMPPRLAGTLQAVAWEVLRLNDRVPSAERIRKWVTSSGVS